MKLFLFRTYFFYVFFLLILITIVFEFYAFLIVSRGRRNKLFKPNIYNYEDFFCGRSLQFYDLKAFSDNCPTEGIITSFKHKSLHVNMWRYANMIVASAVTGLKAYQPECLKHDLSEAFDNLNLPVLSEISGCILPNVMDSVGSIEQWYEQDNRNQSIVFFWTDLYNGNLIDYLDPIRKQFVFNREMVQVAKNVLMRARNSTKNVTYVGVYIPETEKVISKKNGITFPSVYFYIEGINYYRRRFHNAVFLIIVDKSQFWKLNFPSDDVHVVELKSFKSPKFALSVLAHCNHSILGFPDYGLWGALLNGGEAIVSPNFPNDYSDIVKSYSRWRYFEGWKNLTQKRPK